MTAMFKVLFKNMSIVSYASSHQIRYDMENLKYAQNQRNWSWTIHPAHI